jgi:XTP/dITP diphosphohydrolase
VSAARRRLLVASFNPGKARELVRLLAPLGIEVLSLADLGIREPYEETGDSYEENARGKAKHYAARARLPALADDSGLEVDALGGRPGPQSARYGGPGLDDAGRNRLLLKALEEVPEERRTARYVAVAALARPAGDEAGIRTFRATCEGRITTASRGGQGFGYDPIFHHPPFNGTFGEIDPRRKDRVSHRGKAMSQVASFLATPEGRGFLES